MMTRITWKSILPANINWTNKLHFWLAGLQNRSTWSFLRVLEFPLQLEFPILEGLKDKPYMKNYNTIYWKYKESCLGVWTLRAQGKTPVAGVPTLRACPSISHMALVSLKSAGLVKFLISQNCDGLHRRSGFPSDSLAELHGNLNVEYYRNCGRSYLRDFDCSRGRMDHKTGRQCQCGGNLYDSIINFGESLPDKALRDGFSESHKSDLYLVLGSSLTVTPAASMPREAAKKGSKLVICNLQKTPLDSLASLRVFAKTDDLMQRVMTKLNSPICQWKLQRQIRITAHRQETGTVVGTVCGIEPDGTPASVLSAVQVKSKDWKLKWNAKGEPIRFSLDDVGERANFSMVLHFMGHYNEPPVEIKIDESITDLVEKGKTVKLSFNPTSGEWAVSD